MGHGGGGIPGWTVEENGRRGQAGSRHAIIGGKKPWEGGKASERGKGRAFGQTGSRQLGSAWAKKKFGKGGTGECYAQSGMGRCA